MYGTFDSIQYNKPRPVLPTRAGRQKETIRTNPGQVT